MSSETSVPMDTTASSDTAATPPALSQPKRPAPDLKQASVPKKSKPAFIPKRDNAKPLRGQGAVNYLLPEGNAPLPDKAGKTHENKRALCAADESGQPGLVVSHHNVCRAHYTKGACTRPNCNYFHAPVGSIVKGGKVRFEAAGANTHILGMCDALAMDRVKSMASNDANFAKLIPFNAQLADAQAQLEVELGKQAVAEQAAKLQQKTKELEAERRRTEAKDIIDGDGLVTLNFENAPHPFKDAVVRVEPGSIVDINGVSSSQARSSKCIPEEVQELDSGLKNGDFGNYPVIIGRLFEKKFMRKVKKQLNGVYDLQTDTCRLCPGVCCQNLPGVESVFLCPFCLSVVFCSAKCARERGHPQGGALCKPHPVWPS